MENEVHFELCCPAVDDLILRYEFIRPKYYNNPSEFPITLLLIAAQNERTMRNVALFLYKAFNRRLSLNVVKNSD